MEQETNLTPTEIFAPDALSQLNINACLEDTQKGSIETSTRNVIDDLLTDKSKSVSNNIKKIDMEQQQAVGSIDKVAINIEKVELNSVTSILEVPETASEGLNVSLENVNFPTDSSNPNSNVDEPNTNIKHLSSRFTHIDTKRSNLDTVESENSSVASETNILQMEDLNLVSENLNLPKEQSLINSADSLDPQNDESQGTLDSFVTDNSLQNQMEESIDEDATIRDKKRISDTEKLSAVVTMNFHANLPKSTDDATNLKNLNSTILDIDSDNIISEKNILEPENTEFVQISQDKHDDSQMEGQSIDAEDPFGGDNLSSDNVEQMETDSLVESDVNFQKLGDQADNLQDVVNAKDSNFQSKLKSNSKLNLSKDCETDKDILDNTLQSSVDTQVPETIHNKFDTAINNITDKLNEDLKSSLQDKSMKDKPQDTNVSSSEKSDENEKKVEDDEASPIEADAEQSDVLPGQDDELCIIPDSMKVILPGKTVEKVENEATKLDMSENNTEDTLTKDDESSSKFSGTVRKVSSDLKYTNEDDGEDDKGQDLNEKKDQISMQERSVLTTDIIDIDEGSKNSEIEEITTKEKCKQCGEKKSCKIKVKIGLECYNVCSKTCKTSFKGANNKAMDIPSDGVNSKREKRCANCLLIVESNDERNLSWETMEFCNEECLGKFQTKYGSYCRNCNGSVQAVSLGKYCVRFGYDVRQFCCSTCLEEFKKGLKVCSYCQKDISSGTEGFLAPVGDKGQFKDFCTQDCMEKYSRMSCTEPPSSEKKACSVCQEEKIVHCEVQINRGSPVAICSDPCFAAFKFVNKVDPDQCSTCKKFFELSNKKNFIVFYENEAHTFCNKTCLNIFIITNRKIVPCNWCKVKKYNFDMIKKELKTGQVMMMCSLNCLTLYQVSVNAVSARRINCDFCKEFSQAQYHLTMSDATIRNFCSYNCVMNFQGQYTKSPITIPSSDDPVPTGMPKRTIPQRTIVQTTQKTNEMQSKKSLPVISSVTSLASIGNEQASPVAQQNTVNNVGVSTTVPVQSQPSQVIYKQQIITRPPSPVKIHNKTTHCKPVMHTKGVSVRPHPCTKSTQTEEIQRMVVPIPVPIYVPYPMHMYSMPFPVPLPFPLPVPVPIFIPTTRNSSKSIIKDIKRIQEKMPADPFEAELLMMAEMVATEKKANESDSDSGDDNR